MRPESDQKESEALRTRALRLEYFTIAWNIGEAFVTIGLGSVASSLALIGFGTVSVVEVFASSVVLWHLRPGTDDQLVRRTRRALKMIAGAFAALALALMIAALNDLITGRVADESPWGIAYLAVTALVMFGLAYSKKTTADDLGSGPLASEASVTFLDGVLSTTTLAGLALNAYVGWWWADPAAGLLVALAALNEARETWKETVDP